jgi:hypothetical protein
VSNRTLPPLTEFNRPYWTGGRDGQLLIQRCRRCRHWQHPPIDRCEVCGSDVAAEPVSGRGTVFTFTVNYQPFQADVPTPYVIAVVELAEQADLRLPTNIVDCPIELLRCGLPVEVEFEEQGDAYVPVFRPQRNSGHDRS